MGHTRLGELPKGQRWKAVVAAMARLDDSPNDLLTDDVELIAQKTLDAAQAGLEKATEDEGLRYTFFLLQSLELPKETLLPLKFTSSAAHHQVFVRYMR